VQTNFIMAAGYELDKRHEEIHSVPLLGRI
jgi:hypothetical protein